MSKELQTTPVPVHGREDDVLVVLNVLGGHLHLHGVQLHERGKFGSLQSLLIWGGLRKSGVPYSGPCDKGILLFGGRCQGPLFS